MKLFILVIVVFIVLVLCGTSGFAAAPTCTVPSGYVEYVGVVRAATNANEKCIATAARYKGRVHFAFTDGEFDFSGTQAEGVAQETSKDKCTVVVGQSFGKDDIRFLTVKFDANWNRGTGIILDDGCSMPLRFTRDHS